MLVLVLALVIAIVLVPACAPAPPSSSPIAQTPTPVASAPKPESDAGPTESAAAASPALERVACDENGVFVVPPTLRADLACHPNCPREGVPVPFRIVNCTDRTLRLGGVGHSSGNVFGEMVRGDWKRAIEPGTQSPELFALVRAPDTHVLRLELESVDAKDDKPARVDVKLEISDKKREQALADCKRRGDHWAARTAAVETCWKVMRDQGKTCHDGKDCQGDCVLVSEKNVSATEKLVTGTCSRFQNELGCAARIGDTNKGRVPKDYVIPRVCAD